MPHSGHADHHVAKMYNMIQSILRNDNGMQIIGSDFNAELRLRIGIEQQVLDNTLSKEANNRGEWMNQCSRST